MRERKGEKIGWTLGWCATFIWVFILSIVFIFKGSYLAAVSGIFLTVAAVISIIFFAPWRFPETPYWKLMLVPYLFFLLSIGWAFFSFFSAIEAEMNWWGFFWFLPMIIPFGTLSKRRWIDGNEAELNNRDSD